MEKIDDLLYDDVEVKYLKLQNKKKNRKKRRRRNQLIVLAVLILVVALYFISDFSKVKTLNVVGNRYYSKEEVLVKADLSYESRYLLNPKWYLSSKLEKDDMIETVEVYKNLKGNITLKVEEKIIIGYFVENQKNYLLFGDGTQKEIDEKHLDNIVNYPLIDGFNKKERENLAKGFSKKGDEVDQEILAMISEITPHKESYDEHMVKLVMQDGNKIYTSYESIYILNSYKQTLKKLKKDHVCIVMDANTKTYITEDCKAFN